MAITNYTELQTAAANWLDRTDLTSRIPEFITLAEAKIKRKLRRTAVRANMTVATAVVSLPAAVAELRSIRFVSSSKSEDLPVEIVTPERRAEVLASYGGSSNRPTVAAIVGTEILFAPAPDDTYTAEITYFPTLTALSVGSPTNSVLTEAPDLYLYGTLAEAAPYLKDDVRVPLWAGAFQDALDSLNLAREREEYGASLRPARLPRVFG